MLNIHLTLPMVVNMLRVIAQREPERVGKSEQGGCVYAVADGHILTPVCIVGQMFADMGLLRLLMTTPSDLNYSSAQPSTCASSSIWFWEALEKFGITADEDAQDFAASVQTNQDEGRTWGVSFANAAESYRNEQEADLHQRLDSLFL